MIRNVFLALSLVLLLAACAPSTPAVQVDINQVQTEAVAAYQTSIPKDTPVFLPTFTQTVQPTNTTLPPTPTLFSVPLSLPTVAVVTSPTPRGEIQYYAGDHAEFSSQIPADWPILKQDEKIAVSWTLSNNGSTTWDSGYSFRWVEGINTWGINKVSLMSVVEPGETGSAAIDVFAPETKGNYITYWALFNADGEQIYRVYFAFVVK
jgi:Ig-like domain from next to BRCA1 gene